jgi:hypothetical protein
MHAVAATLGRRCSAAWAAGRSRPARARASAPLGLRLGRRSRAGAAGGQAGVCCNFRGICGLGADAATAVRVAAEVSRSNCSQNFRFTPLLLPLAYLLTACLPDPPTKAALVDIRCVLAGKGGVCEWLAGCTVGCRGHPCLSPQRCSQQPHPPAACAAGGGSCRVRSLAPAPRDRPRLA